MVEVQEETGHEAEKCLSGWNQVISMSIANIHNNIHMYISILSVKGNAKLM